MTQVTRRVEMIPAASCYLYAVDILSEDIYRLNHGPDGDGYIPIMADICGRTDIIPGGIFMVHTGLRLVDKVRGGRAICDVIFILDGKAIQVHDGEVRLVRVHVDCNGELIATIEYKGRYGTYVDRGDIIGRCTPVGLRSGL